MHLCRKAVDLLQLIDKVLLYSAISISMIDYVCFIPEVILV